MDGDCSLTNVATDLKSKEVLSEGLHAHEVRTHDHSGGVVSAVVVRRRLAVRVVPLLVSVHKTKQ